MIVSYATNWSVIYDPKTFIVQATGCMGAFSKKEGGIKLQADITSSCQPLLKTSRLAKPV
jgi:hypothetical protein